MQLFDGRARRSLVAGLTHDAFVSQDDLRYTGFAPQRTDRMSLTYKQKAEVLSPRNAMTLDTLAGVRAEMARLYRLGLNGKLRTDELTKLVYCLREIRACLEAEALTEIQQRLALLSRDMNNSNGQSIAYQPPLASR